MGIDKVSLVVLSELIQKKAISINTSIDMYSLQANKVCKRENLYKKIKKLEKLKYINQGLKIGKKTSYFITDIGIEFMKEITK